MQVRIAFLVKGEAGRLAGNLAGQFAALGSHYFIVDGKKRHQHITLFDVLLEKKDLKSLYPAIAECLKGRKGIRLSTTSVAGKKNGYVAVYISGNRLLDKFRDFFYSHLKKISSRPDPFFKKTFRPHITLTRYKKKSLGSKVKAKDFPIRYSFRANTIAATLVDGHGQVYKILKQFKLK